MKTAYRSLLTARLPYRIILVLLVGASGGCNLMGWMAHAVHGDKQPSSVRTAEYRGLEGKSIAVLVNASPNTAYSHPYAQAAIRQSVSGRLLQDMPSVQVVDPRQLQQFQNDNPYWSTLPNNELARRLHVDRIIYIDLSRYQTHEPGNAFLWQGVISANVGVAEVEAADPSSFVFSTTLEARYPQSRSVGVVDSDDATIQLGMISRFSRALVNLFHDHEVASAR